MTIICSIIDIHFENDLWINWPPAPAIVKFLARNIVWWFLRDIAKFGACDRLGKMKPLYAVPAGTDKTD